MIIKTLGILKEDYLGWSKGKLIPIQYNTSNGELISYWVDIPLNGSLIQKTNSWFMLPINNGWNINQFDLIDTRLTRLLS